MVIVLIFYIFKVLGLVYVRTYIYEQSSDNQVFLERRVTKFLGIRLFGFCVQELHHYKQFNKVHTCPIL